MGPRGVGGRGVKYQFAVDLFSAAEKSKQLYCMYIHIHEKYALNKLGPFDPRREDYCAAVRARVCVVLYHVCGVSFPPR